MLPPFIIEQIRKREEADRRLRQESILQLPLPDAPSRPRVERDSPAGHEPERERERDRGIVIIDLGG